jgi:hypothetical protein
MHRMSKTCLCQNRAKSDNNEHGPCLHLRLPLMLYTRSEVITFCISSTAIKDAQLNTKRSIATKRRATAAQTSLTCPSACMTHEAVHNLPNYCKAGINRNETCAWTVSDNTELEAGIYLDSKILQEAGCGDAGHAGNTSVSANQIHRHNLDPAIVCSDVTVNANSLLVQLP